MRRITAVAAIAIAAGSAARADVVTGWYLTDASFEYRVTHMPDFDQRRASNGMGVIGLPNDGGMYCVPTASTNVLAYVANHGFPTVQPGFTIWSPASMTQYAQITTFLKDDIGVLMSTHPSDGTSGSGWYAGVRPKLPEQQFTVTMYYPMANYTPTFAGLARVAIDGSVMSFAYGYYTFIGYNQLGFPRYDRRGGHVVALSRAVGHPTTPELYVRDPADDFSLYSQSVFMDRKFGIQTVQGEFDGEMRFMDNLLDGNGNPTSAFIDSYQGVRPRSGYSFQPGPQVFILALLPRPILGSNRPQRAEYPLPVGTTVHDVVICPDLHSWMLVTTDAAGGPPQLQVLDGLTGQLAALTEVDNATRAYFGRDRELYVLADWELLCYEMLPGGLNLVGSAFLPGPGDALTYDDAADEVVVLSMTEHVVMRYPKGLPDGAAPTLWFLPGSVPMGNNASISCYPTIPDLPQPPSTVFLVSDASDAVHGITSPPGAGVMVETIDHPSISSPTSVDVDDAGHLLVTNGQVVELMRNAASGQWEEVPAEEAAFGGEPDPGMGFRTTKSRTNFRPEMHVGPRWVNIDPDELVFGEAIVDCDADFNFDRLVDVSDLLDTLAAWGPCDVCVADVDGDRVTGVSELLAVLADWGACP
jgi:hypothetical protein